MLKFVFSPCPSLVSTSAISSSALVLEWSGLSCYQFVLLHEGVEAYKKEGPKFMQRLVAKQKARVKDS